MVTVALLYQIIMTSKRESQPAVGVSISHALNAKRPVPCSGAALDEGIRSQEYRIVVMSDQDTNFEGGMLHQSSLRTVAQTLSITHGYLCSCTAHNAGTLIE